MALSQRFLVVGENPDERALYTRSIARRFPGAKFVECNLATAGKLSPADGHFDAAVIHFNGTPEAFTAVEKMKYLRLAMPIIGLSGVHRGPEAIAAGVTRFLLAEEWLTLPAVLAQELRSSSAEEPLSTA